MNEAEQEIMDLIVQAHTKFIKLDQTHPADMPEWVDGIHSLQGVIADRIVRRDYPDQFKSYPQEQKPEPKEDEAKELEDINYGVLISEAFDGTIYIIGLCMVVYWFLWFLFGGEFTASLNLEKLFRK